MNTKSLKNLLKTLKKTIQKWVGILSKKWSQNDSQNESRDPPGSDQKRDQKRSEKSLKKRPCRCARGHAGHAAKVSREAGFPPNPAGSDPAGALKTLWTRTWCQGHGGGYIYVTPNCFKYLAIAFTCYAVLVAPKWASSWAEFMERYRYAFGSVRQ